MKIYETIFTKLDKFITVNISQILEAVTVSILKNYIRDKVRFKKWFLSNKRLIISKAKTTLFIRSKIKTISNNRI